MSTYREITSMVLDLVKIISDDSIITEDHVAWLIDKYRANLLTQKYEKDPRKQIPDSNYQTICVDLDDSDSFGAGSCSYGKYLKSINKIPDMMRIGTQSISGINFMNYRFALIPPLRFPYIGENRFLQKIIYATINGDGHLYVKGNNTQFKYLKKVKITGIFESPKDVYNMLCDDDCNCEKCDYMDSVFPLEEGLIVNVIKMAVAEVLGAAYRPADFKNDNLDNLADIAAFIRQNMRDKYAKETQVANLQ